MIDRETLSQVFMELDDTINVMESGTAALTAIELGLQESGLSRKCAGEALGFVGRSLELWAKSATRTLAEGLRALPKKRSAG